jgi:uncharacterized membrane protein
VKLKNYSLVSLLLFFTLLAACGPAGPALGLGPPFDQLVGLVLIMFLFVGGYWAVKSFAASPTGHAVIKDVSAAQETLRERDVRGRTQQEQPSTAEEILRERYVRGEIDRKQYLEMLADIQRK